MRKKISDPYKPRKKLSRHAHESIKPCLYGTGALEVGAEKKSQQGNFISKRALGGDPQYQYLRHEKIHDIHELHMNFTCTGTSTSTTSTYMYVCMNACMCT